MAFNYNKITLANLWERQSSIDSSAWVTINNNAAAYDPGDLLGSNSEAPYEFDLSGVIDAGGSGIIRSTQVLDVDYILPELYLVQ